VFKGFFNAANLWNLEPTWVIAIAIAAFVAVANWLVQRRSEKAAPAAGYVLAKLILIAGIAASLSLPVLASSAVTDGFFYRANPGIAAVVAITLVYTTAALPRRRWIALTASLAIATIGSIFAVLNVERIKGPTTRELTLIRAELAKADLVRAQQVHLVLHTPSLPTKLIPYHKINDEFSLPISENPQDILRIIVALLRERDVNTHPWGGDQFCGGRRHGDAECRRKPGYGALPSGMTVSYSTRAGLDSVEMQRPATIIELDKLEQ
jgi:hypothetical protein